MDINDLRTDDLTGGDAPINCPLCANYCDVGGVCLICGYDPREDIDDGWDDPEAGEEL